MVNYLDIDIVPYLIYNQPLKPCWIQIQMGGAYPMVKTFRSVALFTKILTIKNCRKRKTKIKKSFTKILTIILSVKIVLTNTNTIQIFLFPIKEPFRAEQLTKNLIQWLWINYIDWKMTKFLWNNNKSKFNHTINFTCKTTLS